MSFEVIGGGSGGGGGAGAAGVGISTATVDGSGHLILTKTDASTVDAGVVKGTNGTNGTNGSNGATGATGPAGTNGGPGPVPGITDYYQPPEGFIAGSTGSPVTGTTGTVYLMPYAVGPLGQTIKGLACSVTTAAVLGSATITCTLGIYGDDGTGQQPDFTQLIDSVTVTVASASNRYTAFGSTHALTASKRYWLAFLLITTGTPTTAPIFQCISTGMALPHTTATTIGSAIRGYSVAGLSALPTTAQTVAQVGSTTCPVVACRIN